MRSEPPSQHRVARVDGEVHRCTCSSCVGSASTAEHRRRQVDGQLDVLADQPPQHRCVDASHERVEVERLRRQHLLAAEREQLPRQRGRALASLLDQRRARGAAAPGLRQLEQQDAAAPEDHGQHVVEVVGDAAGELADRFHLLRLAQLVVALPQCLVGLPALEELADLAGRCPPPRSMRSSSIGVGGRGPDVITPITSRGRRSGTATSAVAPVRCSHRRRGPPSRSTHVPPARRRAPP